MRGVLPFLAPGPAARTVTRRWLAIVSAVMAAACAPVPASQGGALVGTYGGQHIRMNVGTGETAIEYDCAAGALLGPLPVRGSFVNAGTHTPGTGGPERQGEIRPSYAATYSGRVIADRIELAVDVDLPSGRTRLGPFRLQRGSEGNLLRCL